MGGNLGLLMQIRDSDVRYLAYNYYRDSNSEDQSVVDGVSIGETLACVIWQGLVSIVHYYEEFKHEGPITSAISLPADSSKLRTRVASLFYIVRTTDPPIGQYQNDEDYLKYSNLPIAPFVHFFRIAQRPFRPWIRRRNVLYLANWTMHHVARSRRDSIELFRKSLFKGAAPVLKKKFLLQGELIFSEDAKLLFTRSQFVEALSRQDAMWDETLVDLCVNYANEMYTKMRSNLIKCFALYSDLLENYNPRICCLPVDSFPDWLIVYQICRNRGIETRSFVDGYPVTNLWPIARDKTGSGWLVDEVAAFGSAHKEMILSLGFPEERIFLVEPPFAKLLKKNNTKYDFIIMSWFANCLNIHGDHLSPVSTMRSALKIAVDSGAQSIGIKIKSPLEKKYILPLLIDIPITVEILEGRFFKHVLKAKAIIGGISTAVAESAIAGVPYFIFEPHENGYSDELIDKSLVIQLKKIARTPHELRSLIAAGESSWSAPISELMGI